jgi:hypothetical protein
MAAGFHGLRDVVGGLSNAARMTIVKVVSTINTTIRVGDDSAGILAGLLSHFSEGQRVRVALTEEASPEPGSKADLVEWLKSCPEKDWFNRPAGDETTNDLNPLTLD